MTGSPGLGFFLCGQDKNNLRGVFQFCSVAVIKKKQKTKNNALAQSSVGEERVNMGDDTSRSLSSTDGSLGRNSRTLKQKLRRTMLASQAPACLDLLYMPGLFAHGGCCLPYARPFCIHWQLPTDMPRANLIRAMPQWRPPS